MCMTLSLTLGMSIGLRRTFWMMLGELVGVAIVSIAAIAGVATIMLRYPSGFTFLKFAGGGYLAYLGIRQWQSKGKMALSEAMNTSAKMSRKELATQGFITAIANPKGWAFMISLLPPFIDQSYPIVPQVSLLLIFILIIEFFCMILYASGGKKLRTFLIKKGGTSRLNKVAGTLMIAVGVWLATS